MLRLQIADGDDIIWCANSAQDGLQATAKTSIRDICRTATTFSSNSDTFNQHSNAILQQQNVDIAQLYMGNDTQQPMHHQIFEGLVSKLPQQENKLSGGALFHLREDISVEGGLVLSHEDLEGMIDNTSDVTVASNTRGEFPQVNPTSGAHDQRQLFPAEPRTTAEISVASGEPEFSCPYCVYSSNRRDNLKTHIRRHTGEKPYTCVVCNKRFTCKTGLNMHVKTHSADQSISCDLCPYRAKAKISLKIHMVKHHQQEFKET